MEFELYKNTDIRMIDEDGDEHHFVPRERRVMALTIEEAAVNWVDEVKLPTVGLAYSLHVLDVTLRRVYELIVSTDTNPSQVVFNMYRFRNTDNDTTAALVNHSESEEESPLTSLSSSVATSQEQVAEPNQFEEENAIRAEVESYASQLPRNIAMRANDIDPGVLPAATGRNQASISIPSVARHRFVRNWAEELLWIRKIVESGYNAVSFGVGDLLQAYSPWLTREQNIMIRMFYIMFPQLVIHMPGTLRTSLHLRDAEQRYRDSSVV